MQFLLVPSRFMLFCWGSQAFPWMVRYPSFPLPRAVSRHAESWQGWRSHNRWWTRKKLHEGVCVALVAVLQVEFSEAHRRPHITIEVETVISTVWIWSPKFGKLFVCHLDQFSLVLNLFGCYRVLCITAANCWISLHHSSPSRVSKNNSISKHVRMHILVILVWMDPRGTSTLTTRRRGPFFPNLNLGNEKQKTTFMLPLKLTAKAPGKWMIGRWVFSWDVFFFRGELLVSGNITILDLKKWS